MPIFKPPVYSKQPNASGQVEVSYVFSIEYAKEENGLECIAETVDDLSVASIQKLIGENKSWWDAFLQHFLTQSTKFFSKQYTVQDISKVLRHLVGTVEAWETFSTVHLLPKQIQVLNGVFIIHWKYTLHPIIIDIPGLSDPLPDLNRITIQDSATDDVAELNIDELPMDPTESVELMDPNKVYQKQKVKEAILRAKVAYYRAQNQLRTFSDKYGDHYSDSEFDLEDTENESDSASEEEDQ